MMDDGLKAAIDAAGGTRAALARALNINRQACHAWRKIPITRVLEIERVLGVAREVLRPDYYEKAKKNGRCRETT
jgi:DNA-binding transcriptional regulator YdaS (Cro superfamily)